MIRWEFFNGTIENSCATSVRHIVLHEAYDSPSVCSPNINLSFAGTIRFRLEPWKNHGCNASENSRTAHVPGVVNVWLERTDTKRKVNLVREHDLIKVTY